MFDLTSSKLLIIALMALIVVGPKELPALLRTVGKYVGMIRRHANEFRAQFEEAMRESELAELKKEMESAATEAENSVRDVELSVEKEVSAANAEIDNAVLETEAGGESGPAAASSAKTAGETTALADNVPPVALTDERTQAPEPVKTGA